jgi:hypothetical protein
MTRIRLRFRPALILAEWEPKVSRSIRLDEQPDSERRTPKEEGPA